MITNPSICSWSGGKDSCFALMQAKTDNYFPTVLLNVLNENGKISRSHGIPSAILEKQAESAGIPIRMISSSWAAYEEKFTMALTELARQYSITHAIFGDIDLQAHRDWEEKVCSKAGIRALLPLWQQSRKELVLKMIDSGICATIVSCNDTMGERFIGKMITRELIPELEAIHVDPCGENGEYHTLVSDCPLFQHPVDFSIGGIRAHDGYWFAELR